MRSWGVSYHSLLFLRLRRSQNPSQRRPSSIGDQFARVQDVFGVQRSLQFAHDVYFRSTLVARKVGALHDADTVLSAERAAEIVHDIVHDALNDIPFG